jgi:transposase
LAAELLSVVEFLQQELVAKNAAVQQCDQYIQILEELLRLKRIQQFSASSEKSAHQVHLFDEAELEAEIDVLRDQLPDNVKETEAPPSYRKLRQRGFSDTLLRERIELTFCDEEKFGASKTFFTKVKEELQFIPAQLKVLEYRQEKAVFEHTGEERLVAAACPVHPLGKCTATTLLLAYVITSKYADGLPLYRLEHMLKRLGHEISRTSMAHRVIRLGDVFKPLIHLMREADVKARFRKKFKVATDSDHKQPVFDNVLAREFTAAEPDQAHVTDITYIWTREAWLNLAVFIDLFRTGSRLKHGVTDER